MRVYSAPESTHHSVSHNKISRIISPSANLFEDEDEQNNGKYCEDEDPRINKISLHKDTFI